MPKGSCFPVLVPSFILSEMARQVRERVITGRLKNYF